MNDWKRDRLYQRAASGAEQASREARNTRESLDAARLAFVPTVLLPLVLLCSVVGSFIGSLLARWLMG